MDKIKTIRKKSTKFRVSRIYKKRDGGSAKRKKGIKIPVIRRITKRKSRRRTSWSIWR